MSKISVKFTYVKKAAKKKRLDTLIPLECRQM